MRAIRSAVLATSKRTNMSDQHDQDQNALFPNVNLQDSYKQKLTTAVRSELIDYPAGTVPSEFSVAPAESGAAADAVQGSRMNGEWKINSLSRHVLAVCVLKRGESKQEGGIQAVGRLKGIGTNVTNPCLAAYSLLFNPLCDPPCT